ncbi:hypothetical protein WMY93_014849 [Mugilogobius chulae]|uniref:EF-hand domain-containing protein n=1 Tax=Mugilogobius chulae TaxID=88201 RepID=A0AAW0P2B8_9GOBI
MSDPPTIQVCLGALMGIFDEYAAKDPKGPKDKLSKAELKPLLAKEFCGFGEKGNEETLNQMFELMDMDGDGQVDFEEYMMVLAAFACACHGRPYEGPKK